MFYGHHYFVQRQNRRTIFYFLFGYASLNYGDCCAKVFFELQLDFKEQKSLVQEVINLKTAGHLCIRVFQVLSAKNSIANVEIKSGR